MELEAANSVQQLDFSLMALFIRATLTVKIVMSFYLFLLFGHGQYNSEIF